MVHRTPAKVFFLIPVLLLASTAFLFSSGSKQKSAVASVNGVLIPKAYVEREIRRFEEQAHSQGQLVDESQREQLNRQALDTLIDIELLYQESQRRGFEVTEERIEEQVNGLRTQFGDEEGYAAALEQIGISDAELRSEFRRQLAIQDMIERFTGDLLALDAAVAACDGARLLEIFSRAKAARDAFVDTDKADE